MATDRLLPRGKGLISQNGCLLVPSLTGFGNRLLKTDDAADFEYLGWVRRLG